MTVQILKLVVFSLIQKSDNSFKVLNFRYGVISSKELVHKTFKNLEQRVQLECDGRRIPLPNLQGIVILNIPRFVLTFCTMLYSKIHGLYLLKVHSYTQHSKVCVYLLYSVILNISKSVFSNSTWLY